MKERYLEALRQGGYSPNTLERVAQWLDHLEHFADPKPLEKLRPDDLTRWRQALTWQPNRSGKFYAENTVNQAIGAVRRCFEWAVAQGLLEEDPSAHLKTRRVPSKTQPLGHQERKRMLSLPDLDTLIGIRDRAILGVLLETGITKPACSRLDLNHLQIDTGALRADGRRSGIFSLSDALLGDLEFYLDHARPALARDQNPALFLNRLGARLSAAAIQQSFRHYAAEAEASGH